MNDFFLYKTELQADGGFPLFGVCHLLWIAGIGIFSWWMGKFFSFGEKSKVNCIRHILGYLFPLLEVSRSIVLIATDHFIPYEYPLHLCNMSVWFAAIYLWTGNRFVGVVYVLLCLPAAALAVIFPGWLRYPFGTYMHLHNFIYHGLVVAFGWSLVRSGEMNPQWKELWKPLVFGLAGYIVMYQVNGLLDTNFWFLNKPSYSSPLAIIYEMIGEDWYLVGHFLLCAGIILGWYAYLRWYVKWKCKLRSICKTESIYCRR